MSIRTAVRRAGRGVRRVAGGVSLTGRGGRRRRRRRGISAAGIRAARRLMHLLQDFQRHVPRGRGGFHRRGRRYRGDPYEDEQSGDVREDPTDEELEEEGATE